MKKFSFDGAGNMKVTETMAGVDADGAAIENTRQHDIQSSQLAAHLPMFEPDMSPEELEQAHAIIFDAMQ